MPALNPFIRAILSALCAFLLAGCAAQKPAASIPLPNPSGPIITPDLRPSGEVAMIIPSSRFVIVTFPATSVPSPDRRLSVYRNGLKIGELKITGPRQGDNTIADILSGDPQLHDEVRAD
jgi:hypothetical protein